METKNRIAIEKLIRSVIAINTVIDYVINGNSNITDSDLRDAKIYLDEATHLLQD